MEARKEAWDDAESEANAEDKTNPFNTLAGQLHGWLHQLPVIGFNSGKYDLNMIKRSFVPLLIPNNAAVIKRQNTYMCLYTDKLKFVDICNYLAPGVSYAKYLTAYGCELGKGHFPYEYMDGIGKLEDRALPPQAAFYSQLKSEKISDADYARCQAVWHDNQMTTMRDYLVWYNNRDVTPFLEAISKQFAFYRDRDIDMFKDGISVPGLTLLYLFTYLPSKTYFVTFNRTNSDLHKLVKDNIVGGPAIIFHRYHEKNVTRIRGGGETCRSIVGYDANALYLWALMHDMPSDGIRAVERKRVSGQTSHSRMGRWPSSGSRANRTERDARSDIRVMAAKSELGSFRSMDGVLRRAPPINSMDVSGTVARNATPTPRKRIRRTTRIWPRFWPTRKSTQPTSDVT